MKKKSSYFLLPILLLSLSSLSGCKHNFWTGETYIETAEDFFEKAQGSGKLLLKADLDFTNYNNKLPLPYFDGEIDGDGHKITGVDIKADQDGVGIFSRCSSVKNLIIENASVTVTGERKKVGILAGEINSMENVTVSGVVNAPYSSNVGGIVGKISIDTVGCINNATVTGYEHVGGIVGVNFSLRAEYRFESNTNNGNISGKNYVGGILGYSYFDSAQTDKNEIYEIKNNKNNGEVTATVSYAGGIIGGQAAAGSVKTPMIWNKISNSENNGKISVGDQYAGGITGYTSFTKEITNCKNLENGSVEGKSFIGGIVGYGSTITGSNNKASVKSLSPSIIDGETIANIGGIAGRCEIVSFCTNDGPIETINGGNRVGGLVGTLFYKENTLSTQNTNNGTVKGTADRIGGIIGYAIGKAPSSVMNDSLSKLSNCVNNGEVTSLDISSCYVGGIIGLQTSNPYDKYQSIYNYLEISGSENTALINTAVRYAGGIVGKGEYIQSIMNCKNSGEIYGLAYIGGIAGKAYEISGSENTAHICGGPKDYKDIDSFGEGDDVCVGGIAGWANIVTSCTNKETVGVDDYVTCIGGIVGKLEIPEGKTISGNKNHGIVIGGKGFIGGIAGKIVCLKRSGTSDGACYFKDNHNYAAIIADGRNYAGGLIGYQTSEAYDRSLFGAMGYSYNILNISENSNEGDVSGKNYVAGIIGYGEYADPTSFINNTNTGSISGSSNTGDLYGYLRNNSNNLN